MTKRGSIRYGSELVRALIRYPGLTPVKVVLEHEDGTETAFLIKHVIGTKDDSEMEIVLGEVTG